MMRHMRSLMVRALRAASVITVIAAFATASARDARAQALPPVIQTPINAARKAAAQTDAQTKAAEKAGGAEMTAPQKKSAGAPQKAATPPNAGAAPQAAGGASARVADSTTVSSGGRQRSAVTIYREAFSYSAAGRRDPFVSLMLSGELRPIITDLVLTGVLYVPERGRSLAMLVDGSTGETYRVREGQTLGRMRVTRIGLENITFSIDEFGLSRSETLIIDKTKKTGPAPAPRRP